MERYIDGYKLIKYIPLNKLHAILLQSVKTEAHIHNNKRKAKVFTFWHESEHVILDVEKHRSELRRSDAGKAPQNGTVHKIIAQKDGKNNITALNLAKERDNTSTLNKVESKRDARSPRTTSTEQVCGAACVGLLSSPDSACQQTKRAWSRAVPRRR